MKTENGEKTRLTGYTAPDLCNGSDVFVVLRIRPGHQTAGGGAGECDAVQAGDGRAAPRHRNAAG